MMFAKALRPGVRAGDITTSIRFWAAPRVRTGGRYPLLDGNVEVTGLSEVGAGDITERDARDGGFASLDDLMAVARHGRGERVFRVTFVFVPAVDPI